MNAKSVERIGDSASLFVLRCFWRWFFTSREEFRRAIDSYQTDVDDDRSLFYLDWFFKALCCSWSLALAGFGLSFVGVAYLLSQAGLDRWSTVAAYGVGLFGGASLGGAIDGLWRSVCVTAASREFGRAGAVNARVQELATRARSYRYGILGQILLGVAFIWVAR